MALKLLFLSEDKEKTSAVFSSNLFLFPWTSWVKNCKGVCFFFVPHRCFDALKCILLFATF